jgi:hypothetical protein
MVGVQHNLGAIMLNLLDNMYVQSLLCPKTFASNNHSIHLQWHVPPRHRYWYGVYTSFIRSIGLLDRRKTQLLLLLETRRFPTQS